jgi:hypothetical protein
MAFRVQEFRSQLQYDGARPNLFHCALTFPALAGGGAAQSKYTFFARAASLPGDTVNQVPVYYFGREFKVPGNRTFPEWTVTILNDEDFVIRDAFEKWMSGLNSHVGNLRHPSFENSTGYSQDGYVYHHGKVGDIIKGVKLIGMFPTDISPIELDHGTNDTIEEYSVTFAYQWWEWATGTNGATTDLSATNNVLSPILPPVQ